jgi:AdoMet-dependent heme synthase
MDDGPDSAYPLSPMLGLDTLWFQVAGTVCNLACTHCFISCSPGNRSHDLLGLAAVERHLEDGGRLGVRETYFTGGEPFLNPEILPILAAALRRGPATVLTNGTLIGVARARELKALSDASAYSLDIRVSLDGLDAESNDAIRGKGTFHRILEAVGHLARAGLHPVVTATEVCADLETAAGRERLMSLLRALGVEKPRVKVMPVLRLGAEARRDRGFAPGETLRGWHLDGEALAALQCASGRMVTSRGVYVCPILIESGDARMGSRLEETLRPFPLRHKACHTCHAAGLNCRT